MVRFIIIMTHVVADKSNLARKIRGFLVCCFSRQSENVLCRLIFRTDHSLHQIKAFTSCPIFRTMGPIGLIKKVKSLSSCPHSMQSLRTDMMLNSDLLPPVVLLSCDIDQRGIGCQCQKSQCSTLNIESNAL